MSQLNSWLCSDVLISLLSQYPDGLTEHQLLRLLQQQGHIVLDDDCFSDMMKLFRIHFLLFHRLYALQQELHADQTASLSIHTLKIGLMPFSAGVAGLAEADSLKEYYMDISNLESMLKEELDVMLASFWKTYGQHSSGARQQALALLGLDDTATNPEIKRAWRRLAMRHHPDRGGDEEQIKALNQAVDLLLST